VGVPVALGATGDLPADGGALDAAFLQADLLSLALDTGHAVTIGQGDASHAEASAGSVVLTAGGNLISADFLMGRAGATCNNRAPSVGGTSEIDGLLINGQAIGVTGAPNQTVSLPNGSAIINEQSASVAGNSGQLTVHA